jgi:predicted lipid-binding transport protein (Tim44 family)
VFTALLGERLFGLRTGLWAGLVLATTFGLFRHSQILLPDMIVVFFTAAATHWLWRALAELRRPRRARALHVASRSPYAKAGRPPSAAGRHHPAVEPGGARAASSLEGSERCLAITLTSPAVPHARDQHLASTVPGTTG